MNFAASVRDNPALVREAAHRQQRLADIAASAWQGTSIKFSNGGGTRKHKASPTSVKEKLEEIDKRHTVLKRTALHEACFLGHASTAASLLGKGARADIVDRQGRTPMDLAILYSHSDCVKILAEFVQKRKQTNESGSGSGGQRHSTSSSPTALSPRLLAPRLVSKSIEGIDAADIKKSADRKAADAAKARRTQSAKPRLDQTEEHEPSDAASLFCKRAINYRRRTKFKRPVKPSELNRVHPGIKDVEDFMQKSKRQLGDQSLGHSILSGFRQQRRRAVTAATRRRKTKEQSDTTPESKTMDRKSKTPGRRKTSKSAATKQRSTGRSARKNGSKGRRGGKKRGGDAVLLHTHTKPQARERRGRLALATLVP